MTTKFALFNNVTLFNKTKSKQKCEEAQRIYDLTREIICFNQGKIAEYYFMHDKYQSELIGLIKKLLISPDKKNEKLQSNLVAKYNEYRADVGEKLNKIVFKNLGFGDDYFFNRRKQNVRSCIKILDEKLNVIDPFRQNDKKKYKYDKNTGFQQIIDRNKKKNNYICQNIPEYVAKGNYHNYRINEEYAKKYFKTQPKNIITKFFSQNSKENIDNNWIDCWKGYNNTKANANDCYKSTLIIPMTFKNNSLSKEFNEHLESFEERKDKNTLGFLCFDHIEVDFFNNEKEEDINFCYKIADLVSLYLLKDFTAQNNKHYKVIETIVNHIKSGKVDYLEDYKQINI